MTFLVVGLWVIPSVAIGVFVGHYLGGGSWLGREKPLDRQTVLKALAAMLNSAEQLRANVDSHNTEMAEVGRSVQDLNLPSELQPVQRRLLLQITAALESNERLENDLTVARHRLEEQAVELDLTRREARTDTLSGVPNRKAFNEQLNYQLAAWRRERTPLVLLICDIDHFKWINDTHGHLAGDTVVTQIGSFLRQTLRNADFVARYGGDEFAIILSNITAELAAPVAERIRGMVAKQNFGIGHLQRVATTFSIGYAVVHDGDTAESLIQRADQGLYQAKQDGRNCVRTVENIAATAHAPSERVEQLPQPQQPTPSPEVSENTAMSLIC